MLNILESASVSTTIGNMLFVSLSFLLLVLCIKKFAWKNIVQILKEREDRISNDLDSAENDKIKAHELKIQSENELNQARQESVSIVNEAKEVAKRQQKILVDDAKQEVTELKNQAHRDIESDKTKAYQDVKDNIAQMSFDLATQILNKELDKDTHKELIDSYIEGLVQHEK